MKILLTIVLSAITTLCFADAALTQREDVQQFIQHMNSEYQFNSEALNTLFLDVIPRPEVIKSIKHPAEENPWDKYRRLFVTPTKIHRGISFREEHHAALQRAQTQYHSGRRIRTSWGAELEA